jgi:hypothetical protein
MKTFNLKYQLNQIIQLTTWICLFTEIAEISILQYIENQQKWVQSSTLHQIILLNKNLQLSTTT